MTDWVTDIANFIRQDAAWENAAFAYQMPEKAPSPSVMVIPPIEGLQYDLYLPNRYRGPFQALVRTKNIGEAHQKGAEILRLLEVVNTQMGDLNVVRIVPTSTPIVYPKSDADLYEASVNFEITMIDTRIKTGS
jgi:hypothetical protein